MVHQNEINNVTQKKTKIYMKGKIHKEVKMK